MSSFLINNWNQGLVGISFLIVLILMISGYFYGRTMERFLSPLKKVDCTFLGVLALFGIFEILYMLGIMFKIDTSKLLLAMEVAVVFGPVLALITRSNVLPSWKHLISLALGLFVTVLLINASSKVTTNNIYFDSITYLSQAIEGADASYFFARDYVHGIYSTHVDPLHDMSGYSMIWGLIMRWARECFALKENLLPIYIWGSTALYGMCLGGLVSSTAYIFGNKFWEKALILVASILFLAPYYTNYYNYDLAFFGNTMRPVVIGWLILVVYEIIRKRQPGMFVLVFFLEYAGLCMSSTTLFLNVMIMAALFFSLCFAKEERLFVWIGYIISLFPLLHFGIMVLLGNLYTYAEYIVFSWIIIGALVFIAWLIRKHFDVFCKAGIVLLTLAVIALIAVSYLIHGGTYGYEFFFEARSNMDMMPNMTCPLDQKELIRNVLFYSLLALCCINFRKHFTFKFFLLMLIGLFVNPLVQPFVSTYLTQEVYCRVFDLFLNPFVLVFLMANLVHMLPMVPIKCVAALSVGFASWFYVARGNLTEIYSRSMLPPEEGYNEVYKVTDDSLELYEYVTDHYSKEGEYIRFLSQDVGLKGYVSNIYTLFASSDYRSALAGWTDNEMAKIVANVLYPNRIYGTNDNFGEDADMSKLPDIVEYYDPDYLIISNTMAVWDERGWYDKSYIGLLRSGMCEVEWENDSWALLKVIHDQPVVE